MKNKSTLFITLCMVLCLIPSVGMLFFPTTRTTENRAMAPAPKLVTEDGTLNRAVFSEFEKYFNEHMALRNPLVYTDARIQTSLFGESNVSGVISGTDGWLYYSSTLNDYLGTDVMTGPELSALANNFRVVQAYLQEREIDFILTIAPNKNTLYGEHMPYYKSLVINPDHSAQLLAPYLAKEGVPYLDLFDLFSRQEDVLYLRRDSHWSNKGACLAYNGIMDALNIPHEDYSGAEPTLVKNENGDLNKMLYSFYGKLEENYDYGLTQKYAYEQADATVEDGWIVTENESGNGTLLMFRDSFANTLIPFLSNEFRTACYSKGEPNALERYVETHSPDCVVIQKVERNIANYLLDPPILTAPAGELPTNITMTETNSTIRIEDCLNDVNYYKLSGTVDPDRTDTDYRILVCVDHKVYQAYQHGDHTYSLYLKKGLLTDSAQVQVYIVNADNCTQALYTVLELPQA